MQLTKQMQTECCFLVSMWKKTEGKAVCFISESTPKEFQEQISSKFHSHVVNLKKAGRDAKMAKCRKKHGQSVHHNSHHRQSSTESQDNGIVRKEWDDLVDKFINTPATALQSALELFVPGAAKTQDYTRMDSGLQ